MMYVQNRVQKFHFSGKPKCMPSPQNRWLFVMSQIFIKSLNLNLKIMWRNYTNCKGSSTLTTLLWWFTFLLVHPASPTKSKAFTCAFWQVWTRGLKFFQHSECCFTQHCWQGMFFHKTSGCILPISNIFQNNANYLYKTHTLHVQLWPELHN